MSYIVTAFCTRPWCRVTEFQDLRPSIEFEAREGDLRTVRHIRCPRCKGLATITKAQEVA